MRIKGLHPQNYLRYLVLYKYKEAPLELVPESKTLFFKEANTWPLDYIPEQGVLDKIVLDVGAGCGETAYLYLQYGAKEVICVEPDPAKLDVLVRNREKLNLKVWIIPDVFSLWQMGLKFDYAKIDCEGGEEILLGLDRLPPMTVEIHSLKLATQFHWKFPGMSIQKRYHWPLNTWIGKVPQGGTKSPAARTTQTLQPS